MDSKLFSGDKMPGKEQQKSMEYAAKVASSLINGETKLCVGKEALNVAALFDATEIPYSDMKELKIADHTITVRTDAGALVFSQMGNWCEPFYAALLEAYNEKVKKAMFVSSSPILVAKGNYRYIEGESITVGRGSVEVHDNCVCILTSDLNSRRIPLCFVTAMDKLDYGLTLSVDSSESYTFEKLGHDTIPFANVIEEQIRKLRAKGIEMVKELDSSLSTAQCFAIAKLVVEGMAAPIEKFATIAPSFVSSIEEKIVSSRLKESYDTFKDICEANRIWVGLKKNETGKAKSGQMLQGIIPDMRTGMSTFTIAPDKEAFDEQKPASDPYTLWLIVPSRNGHSCAVEFATPENDYVATFIYHFTGEFEEFARKLNRALEAISFKREVVRLTNQDMKKPENFDYRMTIERNLALNFVRSCFAGRVIHSSPETWKRKLMGMLDGSESGLL